MSMLLRAGATAVLLGVCCAPSARADGRLVSYPLVYRLTPATTEDPVFAYVVFFHTRGNFIGHDSIGTSIPGEIALEDSTDNHDGLGVLPPRRSRCFVWSLGTGATLARKHIGDRVRVRFDLHGTGPQHRTVTLRGAPRKVETTGMPWYRSGDVGRHLSWIGC